MTLQQVASRPILAALVFAGLGFLAGHLLAWWIAKLSPVQVRAPGQKTLGALGDCSPRKQKWATVLGTMLLFSMLGTAMLSGRCQATPEVRPSELWTHGRIAYHLLLIMLLVAATGTDLREYMIPDQITLPGILIGVTLAMIAGDLQITHLWVDWNEEIPGFRPAYVPAWIAAHPHWHGLAWSVAGLGVGAGLTWLVRILSTRILGWESLGFGDVTLMAMIGSFLGWQPVLFVLMLAPLIGLVAALLVRLLTGRHYIPFGPFLALATVVVLLFWKRLWMLEYLGAEAQILSVRKLFGDPIGLAMLAGIGGGLLIVLLGIARSIRPKGATGAPFQDD